MRFNLLTTLCALLATTQLATAADPVRPPTPVEPFSNRQKIGFVTMIGAQACVAGAFVCGYKGDMVSAAGLTAAACCIGTTSGTAGLLTNKQWEASIKKAGDKAKVTCGKVKSGAVVCGEWVVEMVAGAWQVVRRAATAERHFIAHKRALLAGSIDGSKTRGGRKMRRPSRGRKTRDRMPLRF